MLKRFIWLFLSLTLIFCLLFAASVWSLQQLYSEARLQLPNQINCHNSWHWWPIQQSEHCTLELGTNQSILFKQVVDFLPWGLTAHFSVTPIYKGMHFDGQQGQWSLPLWSKRLQFNAHAKGSINTRKLTLQPWSVSGWLQLTPPYRSQIDIDISQFKLVLQEDSLIIDDLMLTIESSNHNAQRFVDRSQLSFKKGRWLTLDELLEVQQFQLSEANLVEDDMLAVLADVHWQGVKVSTASTATRIDPTEFKLYFEQLILEPNKLFKGTTFAVGFSENLKRIATQFSQLAHKNGIKMHIEELHSGIVFQDHTPDAMGLSGDFSLEGMWQVTPRAVGNKEQLKLNFDLDESLLYGPQLELMLGFIEQGWIYQRNKRLLSRVLFSNGKLLANGQLVSVLPLWPSPYEEDH